jgi:hypothetical protein
MVTFGIIYMGLLHLLVCIWANEVRKLRLGSETPKSTKKSIIMLVGKYGLMVLVMWGFELCGVQDVLNLSIINFSQN